MTRRKPDEWCQVPWFGGLTCDHLYADCPSRARIKGRVELEWCAVSGDKYDPHDDPDGYTCGLCLHRHNRTMHKGEQP